MVDNDMEWKRGFVVKELVATENTYVDRLQVRIVMIDCLILSAVMNFLIVYRRSPRH